MLFVAGEEISECENLDISKFETKFSIQNRSRASVM